MTVAVEGPSPPRLPLFFFLPSLSVGERQEVAPGPPYESACRQERGWARRALARSPPPRTPRRTQAIWPSRPPALPTDATPQHGLAHLLHDSFGRARAARSVITSSLALPPPPFGGVGPSASSEDAMLPKRSQPLSSPTARLWQFTY
jgi:hypothetical protein